MRRNQTQRSVLQTTLLTLDGPTTTFQGNGMSHLAYVARNHTITCLSVVMCPSCFLPRNSASIALLRQDLDTQAKSRSLQRSHVTPPGQGNNGRPRPSCCAARQKGRRLPGLQALPHTPPHPVARGHATKISPPPSPRPQRRPSSQQSGLSSVTLLLNRTPRPPQGRPHAHTYTCTHTHASITQDAPRYHHARSTTTL